MTNANVTNTVGKILGYDYKNRLIQVNSGSTIVSEYQYDVLGRRIQKKTSTDTIKYVYDGQDIISETKTNQNNQSFKKTYINGLGIDNLLAYDQEELDTNNPNNIGSMITNRYYFHKNHLGSIIGITNNSGSTVSTYEYDVFGKAHLTTGIDTGNTRLFTGR